MTGNNYNDYSIFTDALAEVYIPDALKKLNECEMEYKFSAEFEKKMNKLIIKERKFYFPLIKTTSRKAVTIAVTALAMLSLMCMSVGAFRNTVANIVSKVFVNTHEESPVSLQNVIVPETTVTSVNTVSETAHNTEAPSSETTSARQTTTSAQTGISETTVKPVTSAKQTTTRYSHTAYNEAFINNHDYYMENFIKPAEEINKRNEKKKYWESYPDEFSPYPYEDLLTNDYIIAADTADMSFCYYTYPVDSKLFIKDNCVEITLKHQYSKYGKVWTPADFSCGNIASVEDLSVKPDNDYIPFRNVLRINLTEHGKDKIAYMIKSLSACEEVMKIRPYYVEYDEYNRYELQRHDTFHTFAESNANAGETETTIVSSAKSEDISSAESEQNGYERGEDNE